MILKFKDKYPQIHSSAWIAPSADVIGDVTMIYLVFIQM